MDQTLAAVSDLRAQRDELAPAELLDQEKTIASETAYVDSLIQELFAHLEKMEALVSQQQASGEYTGPAPVVLRDPFDADNNPHTLTFRATDDTGLVTECFFTVTVLGDSDGDGTADCDDTDETVFPGAPQVCDGSNNDCDDPNWPVVPPTEIDHDGVEARLENGLLTVKLPHKAAVAPKKVEIVVAA